MWLVWSAWIKLISEFIRETQNLKPFHYFMQRTANFLAWVYAETVVSGLLMGKDLFCKTSNLQNCSNLWFYLGEVMLAASAFSLDNTSHMWPTYCSVTLVPFGFVPQRHSCSHLGPGVWEQAWRWWVILGAVFKILPSSIESRLIIPLAVSWTHCILLL